MRFEHIVRNSSGTLQYAVLSDGEARQVHVQCWPAADDRIQRIASATYAEGFDPAQTRGIREEAVRLAHGIAHALVGPSSDVPAAQAWLEAAVRAIEPGAVQSASEASRIRRAEAQQESDMEVLAGDAPAGTHRRRLRRRAS